MFEGAVYDYRHGPQPTTTGEWILRNAVPVTWQIRHEGQDYPATIRYLGHHYGEGRATASLSFELSADGLSASITEQPELLNTDDGQIFQRRITVISEAPELSLIVTAEDGSSDIFAVGDTVLAVPLSAGTPIIAMAQEGPVQALSASIIAGSQDKWGPVAMPGHPNMSAEDARAAALYILSLSGLETEQDVPLNDQGVAYNSTMQYNVGERLTEVHPAFTLDNILPAGFQPKVGGMDFRSDGKLVLASWDRDGAVFLIDPNAAVGKRVRRIAEGLQEPLGLAVVNDEIYVLQKQEVTLLLDHDGDDIIDEYRSFANGWPSNANFHSFAFVLVHQDDYLYALLSICIQPGGATCAEQKPSQGKAIRISLADGSVDYIASGFRFSAGFNGGVNRIARGPDNALYLGEIGNPPDWGEVSKAWYGLDRLTYRGNPAYELLSVNAIEDGFTLTLSEPLAAGITPQVSDLSALQWFYYPKEQYGGPKYDPTELTVTALTLSPDRRQLRATIPGLKERYVVYLSLDRRLKSESEQTLWAYEAWYTLNAIPRPRAIVALSDSIEVPPNTLTAAEQAAGWRLLFDGKTFGDWRNYGSHEPVQKWVVEDGALMLPGDTVGYLKTLANWVLGTASGDLIYGGQKYQDFELRLEWKISENGNSGIFYYVADEEHSAPWQTGLEMQVLHNEGHSNGKIETHRAGDLYDMIAATPETVRPPGQWNEALIRSKDGQVEHWLNGVKVVSFTYGGPEWIAMIADSKYRDMPDHGRANSGYFVLQDHGDTVWYRNIKAREL